LPENAFEFRVPTQETIQSILIRRTNGGEELFKQDFGKEVQPFIQIEVNRINETKWLIPATNQGRRIVKKLQSGSKILLFDQDNQDAIIEGTVGEIIEVQYQSGIGRAQRIRVTLR